MAEIKERVLAHAGPLAPLTAAARRRIMVTGAAGYVGSNIIASLLDDPGILEVRAGVTSRDSAGTLNQLFSAEPRLNIVTGHLPESPWPLNNIDLLIHAAAWISRRARPEDDDCFFRVNTEGTRVLIQEARSAGVKRLVFLSTQAVYGTTRPTPWDESLVVHPETAYARSKVLAEHACYEAAVYMDVFVLRLARVFGWGLGLRWDELPHKFANQAAHMQPITLHGGGSEEVDLVHVRDVCNAVVCACSCPLAPVEARTINIGGGAPVTVAALAQTILDAGGRRGLTAQTVVHRPAVVAPRRFGMNIDRARQLLGWTPQVALSTAAEELLDAASRTSQGAAVSPPPV